MFARPLVNIWRPPSSLRSAHVLAAIMCEPFAQFHSYYRLFSASITLTKVVSCGENGSFLEDNFLVPSKIVLR